MTAFLESLGRHRRRQARRRAADRGAARPAAARRPIKLPGDPKAGQAVFTGKGACIACHKAGAIGASPVGPDLSKIAKQPDARTTSWARSWIPASKGTVSGFPPGVMPKTFGQQLTAKEYLDLVSFLLTLKGGAAPAAAGQAAAKPKP